MFRQCIKHYHQWLRSAIHLKTKFGQSSPDSISLQGPSKRTSSGLLYPVSSVKECNRKGGKLKISRVLQSPVSSPQASPKVEASNRPKQAQHLPTCRKVQNGNTRVHQDPSDSRGMGVVDRLIRHLPSHPHPPKLKEEPKVLPQITGVPVYLPFGLAMAPQVFTMIVKEVKLMAPQGALEISSVVGQPPSLDRNHVSTPRMVAESHKCDERCRPSSQRPQYPTLLHIKVLELKAVSLALQSFKDQCENQTVLVATDNSTVVAYINK